jgi:hypothetical protein
MLYFLDEKGPLKVELVFLRLGHIYLKLAHHHLSESDTPLSQLQGQLSNIDESSAVIAKKMYLSSCVVAGTSQSWLGVGRACYALRQYGEAEDAFSVSFFGYCLFITHTEKIPGRKPTSSTIATVKFGHI